MRMWNIEPRWLCNKHLLGEHVEMHMFVGTINKGISIQGYIDGGLVDPLLIIRRHELLAEEMVRRGMNHASPIKPIEREHATLAPGKLLPPQLTELRRRCADCRERIEWYTENKA